MSRELTKNSNGIAQRILGTGDLCLDAWGHQKVVSDHSLFHGMFTFDIPPFMWLLSENGSELLDPSTSTRSGSVGGMLSLKSGTTLNDISAIESRRHPRYQPNRGHLYSSSIILPNPTQGEVDFGLFVDEENGVFFRRKDDGNLYACIMSNSVLTDEELIDVPDIIDLSKGNIYDIQMQWRGVGDIRFFIGNPRTGASEEVHVIRLLNKLTGVSIQNPALSIAFKATNTTGTEASVKCGCVDVTSESGDKEREQYTSTVNTVTASAGAYILAIRSPELINGKINTRDLRLARISANSDKKVKIALYRTRDTTAFVGGAWVALGSGSYIEENITLTSIDTAKMSLVTKFNVEANAHGEVTNPQPDSIDFFAVHGDHLVLVCDSGASATIDGVVEFGEEV